MVRLSELLPAAAAALLAVASCGGSDRPRPNIVLISLDTVRADALTFQDATIAPHLTDLARRGTVFSEAVSGSSWTLPAHVQMFTGCPPTLHGVEHDDVTIDPRLPSLPEILAADGYATAGFFTGWYLAGQYGFERGFDVYRNAMTDGAALEEAFAEALDGGRTFQSATADRESASHADVTSRNVVDAARAELDRLAAESPDRPVFLFAHFFDPHFDYVPPPPYDELFDAGYKGSIDGRDFFFNERIYDESKNPPRQVSDRDLEHLVALYHGELAWTDAAVGALLVLLEERGLLENAIVVVTSDHGEEFFEHGGRGHRQGLFEEVVRVPLLVVPPRASGARGTTGAEPAAHSDAPVSLSDVAPTILDLADIDVPSTMFGQSLAPALAGKPIEERPTVSSLYRYEVVPNRGYRHFLLHLARSPRWTLTRSLEVETDGRIVTRGAMYHDLLSDPGQRRAVTDLDSVAVRNSWNELETELERMRAHWKRLGHTPVIERKTGIADTLIDDLRSLGYLDGVEDDPGLRTEHLPWGLGPLPRVPIPAGAK